jgi:hypothetical protein
MAITPGSIIDEVQRHLQDAGAAVWADADCVEYINNALYMLMLLRPHAFSSIAAVQLVAGSKQTIASAYMLLDITRNMGAAGTTPGKIITEVERWQIDLLNQFWHQKTGKTYTEHFSYEPEKNLTTYYVFPPVSSTAPHYVETNIAAYPTKVTTANQATQVSIDQTYEPFIKEWMFYEAYNKETSVASKEQATRHLANAASMVGMKIQALREAQQNAEGGK